VNVRARGRTPTESFDKLNYLTYNDLYTESKTTRVMISSIPAAAQPTENKSFIQKSTIQTISIVVLQVLKWAQYPVTFLIQSQRVVNVWAIPNSLLYLAIGCLHWYRAWENARIQKQWMQNFKKPEFQQLDPTSFRVDVDNPCEDTIVRQLIALENQKQKIERIFLKATLWNTSVNLLTTAISSATIITVKVIVIAAGITAPYIPITVGICLACIGIAILVATYVVQYGMLLIYRPHNFHELISCTYLKQYFRWTMVAVRGWFHSRVEGFYKSTPSDSLQKRILERALKWQKEALEYQKEKYRDTEIRLTNAGWQDFIRLTGLASDYSDKMSRAVLSLKNKGRLTLKVQRVFRERLGIDIEKTLQERQEKMPECHNDAEALDYKIREYFGKDERQVVQSIEEINAGR